MKFTTSTESAETPKKITLRQDNNDVDILVDDVAVAFFSGSAGTLSVYRSVLQNYGMSLKALG